MIILDERNFVRPALESKDFGIFDFFEELTVVDTASFSQLGLTRRADVLLIDARTLLGKRRGPDDFRAVLNTFLGAMFFYEATDEEARRWVEAEAPLLSKMIGGHALPMPELSWTILSNQLQFLWGLLEDQRKLQKHMAQLSLELDQVLQNAEEEMHRAKHLHAALVPRRTEEIRGILFQNRYAAGNGGGGELYDLIQTSTKVYQVLLSSQSYLISSAVIGLLAQHKDRGFDPEAFLRDFRTETETINRARKTRAEVELLLTELDLASQTLTFLTDGKAELLSLTKGLIRPVRGQSIRLEKAEKVVVFSPGFLFNWKEACPGKLLANFIEGQKQLPAAEVLTELFIALKETSGAGFLKRDATVALMEVTRHGIHKV